MDLVQTRAKFDTLRDDLVGQAQALTTQKDAAEATVRDLNTQISSINETVVRLNQTNAELTRKLAEAAQGGFGLPVITPTTVLEAGKKYFGPPGMPARFEVKVPNVEIYGGHFWPEKNSAFAVRAPGLTFVGTSFKWGGSSAPPTKGRKLDIGTCVNCYAPRTTMLACQFDMVNTVLQLNPGSDAICQLFCRTGTMVTGGAVYNGGGGSCLLAFGEYLGSDAENVLRTSPHDPSGPGAFIPTQMVILFNNIMADIGKSATDIRHCKMAIIAFNRYRAKHGHACIGMGFKDEPVPDQTGAEDVYVLHNEFYDGQVQIHRGTKRVTVRGNQWYGLRVNQVNEDHNDEGITANGATGWLERMHLEDNVGFVPVQPTHPFFNPIKPEGIKDLVVKNTDWLVVPAA